MKKMNEFENWFREMRTNGYVPPILYDEYLAFIEKYKIKNERKVKSSD